MKFLKTYFKLLLGFLFVCFSLVAKAQVLNVKEAFNQYQKNQNKKGKSGTVNFDKVFVKRIGDQGLSIPSGTNPYLSNGPKPGDYNQWCKFIKEVNRTYYQKKIKKDRPLAVYTEKEGDLEATNDTPSNAEKITNFGSRNNQNNKILIRGTANIPLNEVPRISLGVLEEDKDFDNGTDITATPLNFTEEFLTITGEGVIGDGANGSNGTGFGDHDFYSVNLLRGQSVTFKVTSTDPDNPISPALLVTNSSGFFEASTIIEGATTNEVKFIADFDDTYFLALADFESYFVGNALTINIFDPSRRGGIGLEGAYSFEATFSGRLEGDFYSVYLEEGDVFGLGTNDKTTAIAELYTPDEQLANGVNGFPAIPIVEESPLPKFGDLLLFYIAPESGMYYFRLIGNLGKYEAEAAVSRPGAEVNKGKKQIVYLDFTGGSITQRPFTFIPPGVDTSSEPQIDEIRELSPFEDFIENWGIENTIRNRTRLAYGITNTVKENIKQDIAASGINPNFEVIIVSDYGNPFLGRKIPELLDKFNISYSKVIIGGTIEESGFNTIGSASAIDTGNYSLDDQAFVLLDLLSDPDSSNNNSINSIPLADGVPVNKVVITTIGNIVSHEIGHFIGNFHTDNFNTKFSIMDTGANLPIAFFAGVDMDLGAKFGDENTIDVDFVADDYVRFGFFSASGKNETKLNTAFGLGYFSRFASKSTSKDISIISLENDFNTLEKNVLADLEQTLSQSNAYSLPNPQSADELSKFIFSSEEAGHTSIALFNIQGRKIDEVFNGTVRKGEVKEIEISLSKYNLTSGLYLYRVTTPKNIINHKFIVK